MQFKVLTVSSGLVVLQSQPEKIVVRLQEGDVLVVPDLTAFPTQSVTVNLDEKEQREARQRMLPGDKLGGAK